jgi:hypothetical protein
VFSNWQPLSIPFVGGLDTKTDSKLVSPPKLTVCQNAVFTKHGTLKRRYGYSATPAREVDGSLIESWRGLATQGHQLLLQSDDKLYSHDALRNRYLDRGDLVLLKLEQSAITSTNSAQTFADVASLGDVTVRAWEDSRGGVYASAYNTSTGAAYVTEYQIEDTGEGPMVVAFDGALHVFFYNSATDNIEMVRVNVADVATSMVATPVVVRSDASTSAGVFDVYPQGNVAYLVYATDASASTATVRVAAITSAGGTAAVEDVADNADVTAVAVTCGGTYVHVAHLWDSGDDLDLHYFTPGNLGAVSSETSIRSGGNARTRVAISSQEGVSTVFYQQPGTTIGSYVTSLVNTFTYNVATTTDSSDTVFRHSKLASRPFVHDDTVYVNLGTETTFQSSHFLVRADGLIVGRSNYGLASSQSSRTRLPSVQEASTGVFQWAPRIKRKLDVDPAQKLAAAYTHDTATLQSIDFGADYVTCESGGATYISAGLLYQYDGVSPVESGFLLFPENVLLAGSNGSGTLTVSTTYSYRLYWEWTNASGERERSAALPYAVTMGASDDTVTITVPSLWHTLKAGPRSNVALVVYRTEGNGTVYRRCSSTDPTATGANGWVNNDTGADSVSFTDEMPDTTLVTKELDYQNTGELENVAPAAGSLVTRSQSRMFLAGGTIKPDTILYSKLRTAGQAAGRFNENLTIRVDEEGGEVTALAEMNGIVIIFKEDRIYATAPGDTGASNLGIGSYGVAQLINTDVGCSKPKTVCTTPIGLVFVASKGIYLLEPNLQVRYLGAAVESFGTSAIVSATVTPAQNTIVFLASDGTALIYDYLFDQWGTWTNHRAVDSVLWNDTLVYLDDIGRTMHQARDVYTDAGVFYQMRARLAPIRPVDAGLQGYWRCQKIQLIGEYKSSHELHIDLYRNREDYPIQSVVWQPDTVLNLSTFGGDDFGDGVFGGTGRREYKCDIGVANQKCETLTIEFWDTPGTTIGAGYELTDISLKWAPKTGLGQVSATRKL